jgi:hypothetical protein
MKVQCPGCKKVYYETTEKYDPDVRPNGAMVRLLDPWKGWGWPGFDPDGATKSTTLCAEMLCTGCSDPLAPSGRLTVIQEQKVLDEKMLESLSDEELLFALTIEQQAVLATNSTAPYDTKRLDFIRDELLKRIEPAPLQEDAHFAHDHADAAIEPEPVEVPKPKRKRKAKKKKAKKKIKLSGGNGN